MKIQRFSVKANRRHSADAAPSVFSGSRPHLYHMVCRFDYIYVVLYHIDGVSLVHHLHDVKLRILFFQLRSRC